MISRDLSIGSALRARQRGFLLNPFRFGGADGAGGPTWANVKLLLHCDGANNSTTFTDSSASARAITAGGNAKITTTDPRFGTGAALFDGAGDSLSAASSTDFDLGSNYTIEFQIKPASLASNFGVLHRGTYNNIAGTWGGLAFSIRWIGSACRFYFYATNSANEQYIDVASAFSTAEWRHVAMVRQGTVGRIYVKGVLAGSISGLNTPAASSELLRIGWWSFTGGNEWFNGRLDEIRITKGEALYTADFTPPVAAFPNS